MKNYFPLTDYDFYAYLTSGVLTLAVIDYALNGSEFLSKADWSFIQIAAALALAYVIGHITALLSQLVLESFTFWALLTKPIQLQLGKREPNWIERIIGVLVGRYYEPLPFKTRDRILAATAEALEVPGGDAVDPEDVFQLGFRRSFEVEGVRPRIDSFINQYGFCRNVAFVALLSAFLLGWQAIADDRPHEWAAVIGAAILFIGMLLRFIKFLASCQSEVIRAIIK